jgi:hypothetical protein
VGGNPPVEQAARASRARKQAGIKSWRGVRIANPIIALFGKFRMISLEKPVNK